VWEEHITMQVVETLTKKSVQTKTQVDALTKKFQTLEKYVQESHCNTPISPNL
jgi:uncharacterized coiled-coil protein SlyX